MSPDKAHEIEIIDSAKYPLAVVPAEFTWSDIGNWLALYMLLSDIAGDDMVSSDATRHVDVNSKRLMVSNPDGRLVATAGLEDVIVVTTDDAVLVLHMSQLEKVPETMRQLLEKLTKEGKETYL
jgi:mannose-1-phosphate guanylyltransferase